MVIDSFIHSFIHSQVLTKEGQLCRMATQALLGLHRADFEGRTFEIQQLQNDFSLYVKGSGEF